MHYQRWHRHGSTDLPPKEDRVCKIEGCEAIQDFRRLELCRVHHRETWRERRGICKIEKCGRQARHRSLCQTHYTQYREKQPFSVIQPRVPREEHEGGWKTNYHGYREKVVGGRKVLQHTVVMEEHLGRALRPKENVHHKNKIRHDNRLENLELWTTSQPPGARVSDLMEWAHWLLETYESEEALLGAPLRPVRSPTP